ncbi:hypothetical protein IPR89_21150 [Xanthomonas perforans]|uniref:hypothetical protein n=1 Tax=Xanthomonas perforans TaxID=442694 RepID=UPI0001FD5DB0|nr:hypothetical protein [Xanthomonas perforans]MBZ2500267.1 hypothetical protein [Xanthomonas perforans]MBZ2517776.1 hypothetical protein [Xanthomonas perforans]MBZ2591528.1 hypothetical protein [Xanthomonas perforans]MBZ2794088.1 hypothetical protein [Xanthomonas perforans]MBZ2979474.1 hypothetical protein [Xanthomonas perforans]
MTRRVPEANLFSMHIAPLAKHDASCTARDAANTERAMTNVDALWLRVMRNRVAPIT